MWGYLSLFFSSLIQKAQNMLKHVSSIPIIIFIYFIKNLNLLILQPVSLHNSWLNESSVGGTVGVVSVILIMVSRLCPMIIRLIRCKTINHLFTMVVTLAASAVGVCMTGCTAASWRKPLRAASVHKSVSVHVLLVKLYSRAILRVPVTLAIENKAERLP